MRSSTALRNSVLSFAAALFLVSPSAVLLAQSNAESLLPKPEETSQIVRKNRAPISKEVLRVKLPKPAEFILSNGLHVLVLEDHRTPTVGANFIIRGAGGFDEPVNLPGLATTTEQMLNEGTSTLDSSELAKKMESMSAHTGWSFNFGQPDAYFTSSGLSLNFEQWFPIVVDQLLYSSFSQTQLEKVKQRDRSSLMHQSSDPGFLAQRQLLQVLYRDSPASRMSWTADSIDRFSPEMLRHWHDERYVPQNTILTVTGDVQEEELRTKLETWLRQWKKTTFAPPAFSVPASNAPENTIVVNRPGSVQSTLIFGKRTVTRKDPDFYALALMDAILGGGPGSRLFNDIREKHGYAYTIGSALRADSQDTALWEIRASTRSAVTGDAVRAINDQLKAICTDLVPADELNAAKNHQISEFAMSLESPASVMAYALMPLRLGLPSNYWDSFPAHIQAVSAEDVRRVAKKYASQEQLQLVIAGDAVRVLPLLSTYKPIQNDGAR